MITHSINKLYLEMDFLPFLYSLQLIDIAILFDKSKAFLDVVSFVNALFPRVDQNRSSHIDQIVIDV
jgi:hypothetical protein